MSSLIDADTARNLIAFSSLVVVSMSVVLPALSFRNRNDIKAVRSLVENNHRDPLTGVPINMREEADERHDQNTERLNNIATSIVGIQEDLRGVWKVIRAQGDDLHELEKTVDKPTTIRRKKST